MLRHMRSSVPFGCDRRLRALSRRQAAARGPDGARSRGVHLHGRGRRRVRVAGDRRARAAGARARPGALRPARPRRRGRAELPPAPEGRAVRGRRADPVRRAAHRPLRRRARGGRLRRGLGVHLRALRDHGPPGRRERPARRAAAARAAAGAARRGPGGGAVGDPRQGRRRLRAGRGGPRARHRGGREDRLQRRRRADRADLPAAPRGDRLLPRRAPAARPARRHGARRLRAGPPRRCGTSSATSPTTCGSSTRRSSPSATRSR